ncbi:hypothetical protein BGX21_000463 [Mortierella sp. AD011]|nr:hypothetical protein BGX20_011211 [Mortierella sp. AD010]KAF9401825.1 hypothetical protein BGX21_000463 [Mortierella sp. AD011]
MFTIGLSFDKIKESALNYIINNMATLFSEDKDLFALYRNHPKRYDMLVEVLRRKARRSVRLERSKLASGKFIFSIKD